MRKALTPQEAAVWAFLKGLRTQGFHFRRQAPFRGYYLDFVCFNRRLVIELDGAHHDEPEQAEHDATGDAVLAREGFRTLRLANAALRDNPDGASDVIRAALAEPPPP